MRIGRFLAGLFLAGFAATALLALGAGRPAGADPLPMAPQAVPAATAGSFYFSLGGVAAAWDAPAFSAFDAVVPVAPFPTPGRQFSADQTIVGGGPALTIGVLLPWKLIGHRPRLELSAAGFLGSARSTAGRTDGFFILRSVDGTAFQLVDPSNPFLDATLRTDTAQGSGILRLKADFAIGQAVTVTPQIGLVGGARWTRYRFTYDIQSNTGPPAVLPGSIKETVRSRHLGGQVGADVAWRVGRGLVLHGGMTLAVMHVRATLRASDCQTLVAIVDGSACTGTLYTTTARDTASTTAHRVGGSVGGTWSWGWGQVTVMGFFAWTSDVAGVQNPTTAPNPIGSPTAAPARINFTSSYTYGGAVMVTFPLQ